LDLNETFESRLKSRVKPFLENGRGGDWQHTLRAVEYGRYLLSHEEGVEDIVIPALYLHDIGWSRVDVKDFLKAPPAHKRESETMALHMMHGATLAEEILQGLGYDPLMTHAIVSIVATHDEPGKVFAGGDPSAILVFEADRLDRYGPKSLDRFAAMFGKEGPTEEQRQEGAAYLRSGLKIWFKTKTAKALAEKLAGETGLL
jgi:hypothetical protein